MNNTGISTNLNNGVPASVTNTGLDKDGLHIHVDHRNHAMHAVNNKVIISGVVGLTTVTSVTEEYAHNATSAIKVNDISFLGDFEGLPVSATNPGYVQIGKEVIEYTAAASGELTGITRGLIIQLQKLMSQEKQFVNMKLQGYHSEELIPLIV